MLIGLAYSAGLVVLSLAPIRRPRALGVMSATITIFPLELPFHFALVVALSNWTTLAKADPTDLAGAAGLVLAATIAGGLAVIVFQAQRTASVLETALDEALGTGWRDSATTESDRRRKPLPWARILLAPWPLRPLAVERTKDITYGPSIGSNRLDLYRDRSVASSEAVIVYLHPGGFRWGRKSRESRTLLFHMAGCGWAAISADYHLSRHPADGFPEYLIDVKRVLRWVRVHGVAHGIRSDAPILVAGGSAGAHLAMMTALTANDPTFQPGFTDIDTSVAAGVGLYGYYGDIGDSHSITSPNDLPTDNAPPLFVIHGTADSFTHVDDARRLVQHVEECSSEPVVFAALPGAQHSFDLFASIRNEHAVRAVHGFAEWVRRRPVSTAEE